MWVKVRWRFAADDVATIVPASRAIVDSNNWANKATEYGATWPPKQEKYIQGYIHHHLHRHVDIEE